MAGGSAGYEFATERRSSCLQIASAFPEIADFREVFAFGPKKPFFQAISLRTLG
jgi:hypothetical protein